MKFLQTFLFLILITSISTSKFSENFNKTLWMYWSDHIEKAPFFVQLCYEKIKMACEKDNWNLILLTNQNLPQYIPNFESQFLPLKSKAQHPEWIAVYADQIRFTILDQHGGVWLDISTMLIHDLTWLQNLQLFPYLLTNSDIQKGQYPDVIFPYLSFYQNRAERRDQNGKIQNWLPGYQNWFIISKKKARVMTAWRRNFQKHYTSPFPLMKKEQLQKGYFLKHLSGGEYLNSDKTIDEIVQDKQIQLDKELSLFGERKNANKQLKIVGIHGQYGPFTNYLSLIVDKSKIMTHTLQEIEETLYITLNYFVKSTNSDRSFYVKNIQKLEQIGKTYQNISRDFEKFINQTDVSKYCDQLNFIVQGSVIGILIKDNKKAIQRNIFPITKQQRNKWFEFCRLQKQQQTYPKIRKNYSHFLNQEIKDGNFLKQSLTKILFWLLQDGLITQDTCLKIADFIYRSSWMLIWDAILNIINIFLFLCQYLI